MHVSEEYGRLLEARFGIQTRGEVAATGTYSSVAKVNQKARAKARATTHILIRQLYEAGVMVTPSDLEVQFHPERKWKFDIGWSHWMVAVEIQGMGNHRTVKGFKRDCEKFSAAFALGWSLLPVTHRMVRNGEAALLVVQGLEKRGFLNVQE